MMEAKDVLSYFMELCHDRNEHLQYNFASNAVLDWFGRTIQGNKCIERFLQCDVWPQYEQSFVAAITCDPIETRSTHEHAKETPIENAVLCIPTQTASVSGYESPPPSKRNLDKPPPIQRNKKYKKHMNKEDQTASSSSDDDFESNNKTYNLRRKTYKSASKTTCERSQSQSKNVIKPESIGDQPDGRMLRKRIVSGKIKSDDPEDDRSSSPMKRSKKMLESINDKSCASSSTSSSANGCSPADLNFSKPYSELKYLESIGSIRTIRRAKHPGINIVPTTKAITATPFVSPESQNGWDRKTKLKISYRTGLMKKDDIQFALIIYEPLTTVTRRNLLDEFEKAAAEDDQHRDKASKVHLTPPRESADSLRDSRKLKTPTFRNKSKNDKVSSLRRLRF